MCHDGPMSRDPLLLGDVALTVPTGDAAAAAAAYTALLGEPASEASRWAAGNGSVTLDPSVAEPAAAFQAADTAGAATLLARRGVPVGPGGFLKDVAALGITADAGARAGAPVLDHVVFTAATVDAAVALFGGRLGLDLRLQRVFGDLVQVFFRSTGTVVEVLAGGAEPVPGIHLWGVAWRCDDVDAERERLTAAGLAVSEVRTGRKPGTRVATVRERALGTPTILIEQQRPAAAPDSR